MIQSEWKVRAAFLNGMKAASWLTGSSDSADSFYRHKTPAKYLDLPLIDDAGERVRAAAALARKDVSAHKVTRYNLAGHQCILYGRTHNNLREFRFLQDLAEGHGYSLGLTINVADDAVQRTREKTSDSQVEQICGWLDEAWSTMPPLSGSTAFHGVEFGRAFLNFFESFRATLHDFPQTAVIANDHMPTHVAFATAAKLCGLVTIYVQHAEVSERFPPLFTDIAVLRNEVSRDIYRDIGQTSTKTFVVPRAPSAFVMPDVSLGADTGRTVVIYPSSRVRTDTVKEIADALRANPDVTEICIKPHPGLSSADVQALCKATDVSAISKIPATPHLALVGNSSVAVELLHSGVPAFHVFDLDGIAADYYGFVRAGIMIELRASDLKSAFWENFPPSTDWTRRFSRFDPSVGGAESDESSKLFKEIRAQHKRESRRTPGRSLSYLMTSRVLQRGMKRWPSSTLAAMREVVQGIDTPDSSLQKSSEIAAIRSKAQAQVTEAQSKRRETVRIALLSAQHPSTVITQLHLQKVIPAIEIVQIVEDFLAERIPTGLTILTNPDDALPSSSIAFWLRMKQLAWTAVTPLDGELEKAVAGFRAAHAKSPSIMIRKNQGLLFDVLQKFGRTDLISDSPELFPREFLERLSANKRIDLIKAVRERFSEGGGTTNCPAPEDMNALERLKCKALGWETEPGHPTTHAGLEREFLEIAGESYAQELQAFVLPHYNRLRDRMVYMDVRFDPAIRQDLSQKVISALQRREPFALMRLSEYDAYIFSPQASGFSKTDMKWCERHWWGRELDDALREEVRTYLKNCHANVDVLGIPSVMAFIRNYSYSARSIGTAIQGRGLVRVLESAAEKKGDRLVTEDKINRYLLGGEDFLRTIAQHAEAVVVVSGFERQAILQCSNQARPVEVIELPTHFRTAGLNDSVRAPQPLPFVYRDIAAQVQAGVGPGTLVIVAAGVIGKGFIRDAHEQGAVVIDLGHDLDELVRARTNFLP